MYRVCHEALAPFIPLPLHSENTKEHMVLIEQVWGKDRGCCDVGRGDTNREPSGVPSNRIPPQTIFGTDEFAGDREIAFFIASVKEGAKFTAASSPACLTKAPADGGGVVYERRATPSISTAENAELLASSVLGSINLRAVPVNANDASRRYNPYHLCVVRREVSGRSGGGDGGSGSAQPQLSSPTIDDDVPAPYHCGTDGVDVEHEAVVPSYGRGGDGYCVGQDNDSWAPGYEMEAIGVPRGGKRFAELEVGIEVVSFCAAGVTQVNIHGETSSQSLEEWRLEKDRFDALQRMSFCRR